MNNSSKKTMINIARYASANLFIMIGVVLLPQWLKNRMMALKKEKEKGEEINEIEYYKNFIYENDQIISINKLAIINNSLSDEIIKELFEIKEQEGNE